MDRNSEFYRQVQLLTRILPLVAAEKCFALKGGTAINLFVRDLPRLSVDIDLAYLPSEDRETALKNIRAALSRISAAIQNSFSGSKVLHSPEHSDSQRLIVEHNGVKIKIELSPVLRGTVYPIKVMATTKKTAENFGYAEIQVVSLPDLYAGKFCAALDRQHPRDLFDVKLLLENEGLTEELRKAFLVYLISHNRPIAELLRPNHLDFKDIYESEFKDMAQENATIKELEDAREKLIAGISNGLTQQEKQFLLSFKAKEPKWELLALEGIDQLPAVRWKLHNLGRMATAKHKAALKNLEDVLK